MSGPAARSGALAGLIGPLVDPLAHIPPAERAERKVAAWAAWHKAPALVQLRALWRLWRRFR